MKKSAKHLLTSLIVFLVVFFAIFTANAEELTTEDISESTTVSTTLSEETSTTTEITTVLSTECESSSTQETTELDETTTEATVSETTESTTLPLPESITLNKEKITLGIGEKFTLKATADKNAENAVFSFLSSNETVVSVSEKGTMTALTQGLATITVFVSEDVKAICEITVLPAATDISLNKSTLVIGVGESFNFNSSTPKGTASYKKTWSCSDSSVLKYSKSGIYKALKEGTATVTVKTFNGKTATCNVTVLPAASAVTLNKTALTLGVGESFNLKATLPNGTASYKIIWSSNEASVLKHEGSGAFKALKEGAATVTVKTFNGKKATCKVTVLPAATKISLNKTTLVMGVGESFNFNSSVPKGTASYKKSWSCSDSSVLKYTKSGIYKALKEGTATVTVKTFNGKTASCKVTVLSAPSKITLNKTVLTLGVGESFNFKATLPKGTASYKIIWSSSEASVLKHEGSGSFKALKKGTATVTVKTFNGKKTTCKVTVLPAATSVSLNKSTLVLGVGESFNFNSSIPEGTASYKRNWSTSDSKVLKYTKSGIYKALKAGTATVTVKTFNGKKATCKVTVLEAPSKIKLNTKTLSMGIGESYSFSFTLPEGSASNKITWSSSDTTVLKHNGSGTFTAMKKGSATVTVKTFNGKAATCKVTVLAEPEKIYSEYSSYSISIGGKRKINISCSPEEAHYGKLTFNSSDKSIAYCSEEGTLYAKKMGTVTITAKSQNGKTCSFTVTVGSMKVPYISQMPKYPTGCEGASCTSLLKYYGYDITLDQMINTIPRKDIYYKNGKRYGPDINEYFVGNPRGGYTSSTPGYGAFSPCVTKALQKAIDARDGKHTATKISGCSFDTLLGHISSGRPAIVWATYMMNIPTTVNSWYITETGKYFEYPRGTHVMVLTGYSDSRVTIVDPYKGTVTFNIDTFEARWNLLGKQAIVLM